MELTGWWAKQTLVKKNITQTRNLSENIESLRVGWFASSHKIFNFQLYLLLWCQMT